MLCSDSASRQASINSRAQALIATEARQAEAAKKAAGAHREGGQALEELLGKIDPTVAAMGRLDAMEQKLKSFRSSGALDAETFGEYQTKIEQARSALGGADTALNKTGMTAKATAAALRGVPAQFTDIVVSLQGGQAPLTVLLQQGGQLKDMFGGVGPAVKALSGYVMGLVNPFTVAAAAMTVLGYAYYSGSEEAVGFQKELIKTGNSAGTTADQMSGMARQVAATVGTTGAAAEVLIQLAGSGKIASDSFVGITEAALEWRSATGKAVEETVAEFAKIGKDPVAAAKDLNEQYNFLTASTYSQIVALKEQGDTIGAAKLLTDTYVDTIKNRSKEVTENLSIWERGWKALRGEVADTVDSVKNIGRDQDIASRIVDLQRQVAAAQSAVNADQDDSDAQKKLTNASLELKGLIQQRDTLDAIAKARGLDARQQKAASLAMDKIDALEKSARTNAEKRADALKDYNKSLDAIRKVNPNDERLKPENITRVQADISKQYKDPATRKTPAYREDAGTKALDQARQQYSVLQQQNGLIGAQIGQQQKMGEAGQALVKWEQQLADIKDKKVLTADQKSLLASQQQITTQLQKNAELEKEMQLRKVSTDEAQKLATFQANLNAQLQRASVGLSNNLAGVGLGDVTRQRMQERFNIEKQYQQQLDNLEQQRNEDKITPQLYQKQTAALQKALDERVAMQERYYEDVDDAQRDWTLGAQGAFLSYYETANDFAGQSRQAFTTAFSGMNDALLNFVKTGELSLSDLTTTFVDAALRMLIQWGTAQVIMAGLNAFTSTAAIPLVGPAAAPAAAASSMGEAGSFMTMIGSVAGMAHDGIDNIPNEGTWLLDKGERVVDSRTNSDLKRYLAAASSRESGERSRGDLNIPIQVSVQGQPGMSEADARRQGQLAGEGVRDLIMQVIQEQQRPGGMLA